MTRWVGCPLCGKLHPLVPLRLSQEVGVPEALEPRGKIVCGEHEVVLYVYRPRPGTAAAKPEDKNKGGS